MEIEFDSLPVPEPSSLVGFSSNTLIRDAENRSEETIELALKNQKTRFFLFADNRVILKKTETTTVLYSAEDVKAFSPDYSNAILLGDAKDGPRVAVPCDIDPEALEEPWTSYDLRSLLYSNSVGPEDAGAIAQAGSMFVWHATNQFCGKCGAASQSKIGGFRRDCNVCDHKIFPRTDPAVIMLPIKGDRCVMGRSPHFPPGWFSTLAGFVEPGETLEDAVRRETFEESGITIGRVKYHASQPWPFPHSLMIGLHCEATSETINMDQTELEDCRWFTRDEVRLMLREEHPDGFICPPNKAISSALILAWTAA